jgi:F0F1-type ATP synthase assembly protein I
MSSSDPSAPKSGSLMRQLALAMELPFVMIGGVVIGGGIGYLIDRAAHTSPAFTLVGGLLGFAGGIWDVIRRLLRADKNERGSNGSGG